MLNSKKLLQRAETTMRESKFLDFKSEFDLASAEAWCGIIKDIIAFSNSGGGIIVFGVENNGEDAMMDSAALLAYDTADITNRIARYTNYQFADIEIIEVERKGKIHAAFLIGAADVPIVFTKPGTYDIGGGKQKTAFAQGAIYFRHGSKSEPGNRDDLLSWRDREVARVRKSWLGGIRQVVETEGNETVTVISSKSAAATTGSIIKAALSNDPSAIQVVPGNTEELWPHRQKDLINEVNTQLGGDARINSFDVLLLKEKYDIFNAHRDFAHKPHKLASPQYSESYVQWIVGNFKRDKAFFQKLREEHKQKIEAKHK